MQITVNGQKKVIENPLSLKNTINTFCSNPVHGVAELNGQIIKKHLWQETPLNEGDALELVTFVGGG